MRNLALSLIVASLAATAGPAVAASSIQAPACDSSATANHQRVLDFYRLALVDLQPRQAFERHVSPDFVEHKPGVAGGTREATIAFLEGLIAELPDPRWEILRSAGSGDLVFLHARFTPAPGAGSYALADVFRLEDCLIVEHWDVVSPPSDRTGNPHPRF